MRGQLTAAAGQSKAQSCPQCGADTPYDERFVAWCAACDWNVDPGGAEPVRGRFEAKQRRLAHRYGEQLHAELLADPDAAKGGDRSGTLARVVAVAVHAVTAVLAVGGILLVVLGWNTVVQPLIGAILLVAAVVLRPRFGRLRHDGPVLRRADAPRLYALVDEVASAVGTHGVDAVTVDADFNASVATFGLKSRRVLHIGLGLWEVLDQQERVALLGHELGHYANGDQRRGRLIGTALASLHTWLYFLTPVRTPHRRRTIPEMLTDLLMDVPRWAVYAVTLLLERLTLRDKQRAEYFADRAAVRVGSAAAAAGLMDRLLIGDSVESALRTESVRAQTRIGGAQPRAAADGLWERSAERAATVPEREYERLRRVAALRGHSVDATHPPTHLRRHLIEAGEPAAAAVVIDPEAAAAIAAELAPARETVAHAVIRDPAG
ncbi:M48 family metallopeptidase [Streptomyces sp. WM6378]|uniref:M48 family metallopeptidase n=1 Tax=Streptomyces sp. WM6378 TaxID=1415557 RepID=UPI0006AEBA5E|nr:M48 family metallopeptidase [Streptomyces sp. WM6378]